jgi:hypothetical protein
MSTTNSLSGLDNLGLNSVIKQTGPGDALTKNGRVFSRRGKVPFLR